MADTAAEALAQDDSTAPRDDETLRAKAMAAEPAAGAVDAGSTPPPGAVAAAVEGEGSMSLESTLVILGIVLVVTGGGLLLLTWLSRRAADPLLR